MSVIDTLITDRTQADVDRVRTLTALWVTLPTGAIQWTGTAAELSEYMASLGGAYTAYDWTRVTGAMTYLAQRLQSYGYAITLLPLPVYDGTAIPPKAPTEDYLANVVTLRSVLTVLPTTPAVPPDMEGLTWQEANDIERILADIDHLLTNAAAAFRHCNAAVCGGNNMLIR